MRVSQLGLAMVLVALALPAMAQQGITPRQVAFAQIAALEGPASALGQGMRLGIRAAFEEANRSGGVHGRQITLTSIDDGYEPTRSLDAMREVITGDAHIAVIGPVGTPTLKATQPVATRAGLPLIGPFTGAGFLRDPALRNVVNIRQTYAAETEAWIKHLVDQQGMQRIAILYQDDGFGRVGLAGVEAALGNRGMSLVAEGTYMRNTTAIKTALLRIRKAEPEAVVMVGAYRPLAAFITLSRALGMEPTFVNISFVGSRALAEELGADGAGVIISQVVPFPWDTEIPVVAAYQAALQAIDPNAKPDFVSLEGYIAGRVALRALDHAGAALTRESYLQSLGALRDVDLGGMALHFGAGDNQGSDTVFMTRIGAGGSFEPIPASQL